jgi:hypothetical protein
VPDAPWWTAADEAEWQLIVWVVLTGPRCERAVRLMLDWNHRRHLLSKAEWLRRRHLHDRLAEIAELTA